MKNEPIISIIIPVYNPGKLLIDCLDSIIGDSFSYYEIICVDDMSTDGSKSIINNYIKSHDNIRLFSCKEHKGAGGARNIGLKKAKGKYVWFVDSDDAIAENALSTISEYVKKDIDILFFEMEEIENNHKSLKKLCPSHSNYEEILDGINFFKKLFNQNEYNSSVCTKVVKKELLEVNNILFKENIMYEDELFSLEVIIKAKKMCVISDVLYRYIKHNDSVMTNKIGYYNLFSMISILSGIEERKIKEQGIEFSKYYNILFDRTKYIYLDVGKSELVKIRDKKLKKYLLKIEDSLYDEFFFNGINEKCIKDYAQRKIYIWGAGKLGKVFGYYLKNKNYDVESYIVSDTLVNEELIQDINVISFENYLKKRSTKDIIYIMISDEKVVLSIIEKINSARINDTIVKTYFDIKME